MLKILGFLFITAWYPSPQWHGNMQEAMQIAQKEHRCILLNFSGSDWCGPCILLRKEVFDAPAFSAFADTALVLVNADFPRMKKNQLSKDQQQLNEKLADRYNPQGKFPLTILLDEKGKIIQQWEGGLSITSDAFSEEVKKLIKHKQQQ